MSLEKLRLIYAFLDMSWIWSFQANFCEMMTPKYLLLFSSERVSWWMWYGAMIGDFNNKLAFNDIL